MCTILETRVRNFDGQGIAHSARLEERYEERFRIEDCGRVHVYRIQRHSFSFFVTTATTPQEFVLDVTHVTGIATFAPKGTGVGKHNVGVVWLCSLSSGL